MLIDCDLCYAGAFSCYQAALQLRPNFPQGLNNLAVIFTAQGRAQDALQMLQAAIAAAPDYAEAYNNLGVLQREVGAIKVVLSLHPFASMPANNGCLVHAVLCVQELDWASRIGWSFRI